MGQNMKSIFAGITGGLIFLIFLLILKLSFFIALLAAVATFVGTGLVMGASPKQLVVMGIDEIDAEALEKTISEGQQKLKEIRGYGAKIKSPDVKAAIQEICEVADRIFENLEKKPSGVKTVRKFFSYYLGATTNILERYIEISEQDLDTAKIQDTLKKVEGILDSIKVSFKKQQEKLLENDVMDLDAEISLLQNMIKSEDF